MPETVPAPAADAPTPAVGGAQFPIVGIGASAGGLEALQQLLGAVPVDTGMGFVIVQHLAPDHASSLAEILARATTMPVCEVSDEPVVEPDHVYVIPPGRDMIVAGGKLMLLPQQRHAAHRGIDRFFRSLAADAAHLAIGVVLSGGLSDGTVGLEEIKGAGGVTFAQDDTAQHDSMPRSAVASGCVDYVLPPEKIAHELARIARHSYIGKRADEEDEAGDHLAIADIIRGATGVDFTHYKASTLRRRITRRMMLHRLDTQAEYEEHLRNTPEEVEELYQDILISVTSFFRDPDAFEALARDVFPKLIAACPAGEAVRMWIAGCSSGEEAYSLAMAFAECAEADGSLTRWQIFATDVNPRCVEKARAGWYPRSIAQDVPPERLRRFFTEEGGGFRVRKTIRERCVFSRHNLLGDPPFSRVDLISCRNLLIYLEPVLQQRLMPIFHYALKPGGWLLLGSSESVGATSTLFDAADLRHKIFTRRAGDRPPATRARVTPSGTFTHETPGPRQPGHGVLHRDAERLLLAKYAPPGVVVSAGLEIVQFQGDTSPWLAPASGAASHHLLKMLREGLAGGVREALQRAEKEGGPVRAEGLRVGSGGGFRALAVEVIPIKAAPGRSGGFVVLFDEGAKPAPEPERGSWLGRWWKKLRGSAQAPSRRDEELLHLREELAAMRESLLASSEQHEAVNEELRSANEEAQSANEEMQSVNEELETSKEEMEASNEELATLNDELGQRNAELNRVNEAVRMARDSAERIVENVPRPLLVLNGKLRVQTASRAFYEAFQTAPSETADCFLYDLGNGQWDIPELRTLLGEVLPKNGEVRDFEVRHTFKKLGARVMQLNARALTHIAGDESLMILSIEDITERDEAQRALRQSEERFRAAVGAVSSLIWTNNAGGMMEGEQPGWSDFTGQPPGEYQGYGWATAVHPDDAAPTLAEWNKAVAEKRRFEFEHRVRRRDGEWRLFSVCAVPVLNDDGSIREWIGVHTDITERRAANEALRASEARMEAILRSALDAIIIMDHSGRLVEFNPTAEKIFGFQRAEVIGRELAEIVIPERLRARHRAGLAHLLATGEGPVLNKLIELPALRADGTEFPAEFAIIAIPGAEPPLFTAFLRDITERKEVEQTLVTRAEDLARADRSKDEFLAMLAHELRNPLAPLRNAAELLKAAGVSEDERAQAQRILGRSIENMSRMIDDLLDVSRITEGKISLRKEPVQLETVLTAALSVARSACAAHRQELTVTLPAAPVWLHADATRLEQVFVNLLGNASKYSGDGSHIWLSAEVEKGARETVVRVRDNGAGIEAELLPRVFDLFVQANRALDRAHGGLGIGLTLVRRLVDLHGGSVEAHSSGPGHGAEFIVRLPVLTNAPAPAPLPPPSAAPENPRRILIVDDNSDSARSLAMLQRQRGHNARTAFTGPDALTAAAEFIPEVVLLDIGLPGMDGFEVARQIRAMPALAGVFLVAMSGYGSAADRAAARAAGFDEYLVKPIDLALLRERLRGTR